MVVIVLLLSILLMSIFYKKYKKSKHPRAYARGCLPECKLEISFGGSELDTNKFKREQQKSIDKLISSFTPPQNITDAFSGIYNAINDLSKKHGILEKNFDQIWLECQTENKNKTELGIRKKLEIHYKDRSDLENLIEALRFCLIHIRFFIENSNLELKWKVSTSIKRLTKNLNHENYIPACIGFLKLVPDIVKLRYPEIDKLCQEEIERMFSSWHFSIQAEVRYEENLINLVKNNSISDKHFILNELIGYVSKIIVFEPNRRDELVSLCKEDIRLYKYFLAELTDSYKKNISFEEALKSENYLCPNLPSFNTLWAIYENENNESELEILKKIAREIKYPLFDEENF